MGSQSQTRLTHVHLFTAEAVPAVFRLSQEPKDCPGKGTASGEGRG